MSTKQGAFIVIEGTDGSGKETQFKLLASGLTQLGYRIATFDFPRYGEASAAPIEDYLNGVYGSLKEVGPYAGSILFTIDRVAAKPAIQKALDSGQIVLCNRYTASNMAHQGAKISNSSQKRQYFSWLDDLEFVKCELPRPDKNLILSVPAEIAQKMVDKKAKRSYTGQKRDIHEADLKHLQSSVDVYQELCDLFPNQFIKVDCLRHGALMSIEQIHQKIMQLTIKVIEEK